MSAVNGLSRWVQRHRQRLLGPDGANVVRRHLEMRADQAWALSASALRRAVPPAPAASSGDRPRFAVVTVNFSTTRYLKLMLLTLSEQRDLGLVDRMVIVDNRSRDGGLPFLRALAERLPRVHLVEHRFFLNHARGMRAGVRCLERADRADAGDDGDDGATAADLLLFCDVDVVFRNEATLATLAGVAAESGAALIGEVRHNGPNPEPDVQASFFVVRRDVYNRKDVLPLVNHGSPAYWLQRSIRRAGLTIVDLPTNQGGFVLHRGRTGVAAARDHLPRHSYAKVASHHPHFMGVPDGPRIWASIEVRHSALLRAEAQAPLLDVLAARFQVLGAGLPRG